jgi:hypothetical protein
MRINFLSNEDTGKQACFELAPGFFIFIDLRYSGPARWNRFGDMDMIRKKNVLFRIVLQRAVSGGQEKIAAGKPPDPGGTGSAGAGKDGGDLRTGGGGNQGDLPAYGDRSRGKALFCRRPRGFQHKPLKKRGGGFLSRRGFAGALAEDRLRHPVPKAKQRVP